MCVCAASSQVVCNLQHMCHGDGQSSYSRHWRVYRPRGAGPGPAPARLCAFADIANGGADSAAWTLRQYSRCDVTLPALPDAWLRLYNDTPIATMAGVDTLLQTLGYSFDYEYVQVGLRFPILARSPVAPGPAPAPFVEILVYRVNKVGGCRLSVVCLFVCSV